MFHVMSDRELVEEWFRFFGLTTGVRLMGWCAVMGIYAPDDADRRWIIEHGFGGVSTRYANVKRLEAFAASLRERGLSLDNGSDEAFIRVERMVAR